METLAAGDVLLRLGAAAAIGLVIGLEREWREKAAGLRTLALVSTGSAIFVLVAMEIAPNEAIRMAAGIATGVGFLGAGAILRDQGEVVGLTTAAVVWMAAALGIAVATGAYALAGGGTFLTLFVLVALPRINLERVQLEARKYEITYGEPTWEEVSASRSLMDAGLRVSLSSFWWTQDGVTAVWRAVGRRDRHEMALKSLREDAAITSFTITE